MASASANPAKESNDQINQSNQTLESSNASKNIIPTSSSDAGEKINTLTITNERSRKTGISY
jgi:hypothetical protein